MVSGRIAGILLLLSLAGCSTISDTFVGGYWEYLHSPGPHVMGGIRTDIAVLSAERSGDKGMLDFLHVIDFPFSLGLDLVFLPFTAVYALLSP